MRMCLAKPGYGSWLLLPVYYLPNKCSVKFYFCSTFTEVYISCCFQLLLVFSVYFVLFQVKFSVSTLTSTQVKIEMLLATLRKIFSQYFDFHFRKN